MKRPRVSGTEPKGDFNSRFIQCRPGHGIAGGRYELIGCQKIDGKWEDLIKNTKGESKWVGHTELLSIVIKEASV